MLNSTSKQTGRLRRRTNHIATVCVVDPCPDNYQSWHDASEARRLRVQVVASAEEALRFARTNLVDLWVINTELPGLSGFELCGMLRSRSRVAPVYLMADHYTPAAEQAAWQARATLFGCRATHHQWLDEWLRSQRFMSC